MKPARQKKLLELYFKLYSDSYVLLQGIPYLLSCWQVISMFEDLLPAVERGIMDAAGSIPVVFKGIERTLEKGIVLGGHSRHEFHELTYLRSGKVEFDIDNRRVVLERGGSLVIRPQKSHQAKVLAGTADIIVLYFGFSQPPLRETLQHQEMKPDFLQKEAISSLHYFGDMVPGQTLKSTDIAPKTLEQFINFANGKDSPESDKAAEPYILIQGKSRQDIASLVGRILKESRQEAYGRELMMQLLAVELLVALARGLREEWEESLRVRSGKAKELVRIARDFIMVNHERDISITDVAGYVFLSPGYFTRAFRDETGMSPSTFLMQVRVGHACKLLEQKEIKVSGVATQVGFSSPQRFNAAFRKHIGKTPIEYRRQILAKKAGRS
jgi:AraC-like DNA-binding protein